MGRTWRLDTRCPSLLPPDTATATVLFSFCLMFFIVLTNVLFLFWCCYLCVCVVPYCSVLFVQLCRFCSTYYYDTHELYVHMRDDHFTCHLCPGAHSHRYYRHFSDLLQHFSTSHFLCSLCLKAQMASSTGITDRGDGVAAFRRQGEYAEVGQDVTCHHLRRVLRWLGQ